MCTNIRFPRLPATTPIRWHWRQKFSHKNTCPRNIWLGQKTKCSVLARVRRMMRPMSSSMWFGPLSITTTFVRKEMLSPLSQRQKLLPRMLEARPHSKMAAGMVCSREELLNNLSKVDIEATCGTFCFEESVLGDGSSFPTGAF